MSETSEKSKKKSFFKSFLIYLFLVYVGFVTADLLLLKFVRPQFVAKLATKDQAGLNLAREKETSGYQLGEIDSKDTFTSQIVKRNFLSTKPIPLPLAKLRQEPGAVEEEEDAAPVPTNLALTLEGTAVHRNPFRSLATIQVSDGSKSFTVGDVAENVAEIISVLRKKVIFRNLQNKKLEYIEIKSETVKAKRPPLKRKKATPLNAKTGPIKREGNRFSAKRSDVNKYKKNMAKILTEANNAPVVDPATGEFLGFKIFDIVPGSIIEQLGIENNDVISSVNGLKLSPANMGSLMSKFQSASDISITINRNGVEQELDYSIDEDE